MPRVASFELENPRRCEQCGDPYEPYRDNQRFCPGGDCRRAYHAERQPGDAEPRRWWIIPTRGDVPPGQIVAEHYHQDDLGHTFRTAGRIVARFGAEWVRLVVSEAAALEPDASPFAGLV